MRINDDFNGLFKEIFIYLYYQLFPVGPTRILEFTDMEVRTLSLGGSLFTLQGPP